MQGLLSLIILTSIFALFKSTPAEEQRQRDLKTINLFLSRYQYKQDIIQPLNYSFFRIDLTKVRYYPPIMKGLVIETVSDKPHQLKLSNFILPMLCNVTVQLINTTRDLNENDFIIEVNFKDVVLNVGLAAGENMTIENINDIALVYSRKRSFLVSERFAEFRQNEHRFTETIKEAVTSLGTRLLALSNYLQTDFEEINNLLRGTESTIDKQIGDGMTLVSCTYRVLSLPAFAIIRYSKLEVEDYSNAIDFKLDISGDVKKFTLMMSFSMIKFSSKEATDYSLPKYSGDTKYSAANKLLLSQFKIDSAIKKNYYYARLFADYHPTH